ncbi:MAG: fasciclin domain-containing protein [Egibacteraceae bacterium]
MLPQRTARLLALLAAFLLTLTACEAAQESENVAGTTGAAPVATTPEEVMTTPPEPTEMMTTPEPTEMATATAPADGGAASSDQTLIEVARSSGNFAILLQALQAAGMTEVLQGTGPFTVFAPSDRAFRSLNQQEMTQLLTQPDRIGSILSYHVVPNEQLLASDLEDGMTLDTVQGDTLEVTVQGDQIMVGDATIVQSDLVASNGVIHVIDQVLMPPR